MEDTERPAGIPCAWCGGTGKLKRRPERTLLGDFFLRIVFFFCGFGILIVLLNFVGGWEFSIVAIVLAVILWVSLEIGLLPEIGLLYLFRTREVPCSHCKANDENLAV